MIGFHSNIVDDRVIDDFHKILWNGGENIYPHILGPYISIGTYLHEGGYIKCEIQLKSDYCPSNKKINLSRQNLCNKNFAYNKSDAIFGRSK